MTEKFSEGGTLIFVVGPSGSGKDTLINGAKGFVSEEKFTFITREITRPTDAGGEDHIEIPKRDFNRKVKAGEYALHWQANGHCYSINKELNQLLSAGKTIV